MRENLTRFRFWVTLATALLVSLPGAFGTAAASHGSDEPEGVWHVQHNVTATVVDNLATVDVGVTITNEGPDPEFPFQVEIPDHAYVTGLSITRDGKTWEAEVQPADQARENYEEAKQQGRSAGLVEQTRDTNVYRYDVNVEGTETVRAVLTYQAYLAREGGVYELDLEAPATHRGIDEGARFAVAIQHGAGLEDVDARPGDVVQGSAETAEVAYEVGPRGQGEATPLQVRYEPEETPEQGRLVTTIHNGTGYFAHRLSADANRSSTPVDVSLVLDTSGSMQGDKLAQVEQATRQVIHELDADDRLRLTLFANSARSPWEGLRPVEENTTEDAIDALGGMRAAGGTNIEEGIRSGMSFGNRSSNASGLPVVVFLTDGRATSGITDADRLREIAREANGAGAHVFSLAFGDQADFGLVHGLAEEGQGLSRRVATGQGADLDLENFLTSLTTPILSDVSVEYANDVQAYRVGSPILFAGGEVLHVGTFDPANRSEVDAEVTASLDNREQVWNVSEPVDDEGPPSLVDLVVYQRIRALEKRIDAQGGNATLEEQVTGLALEHGFVTDRTSLEIDLPRSTDDRDEAQDAHGGHGGHGGDADASDTHASDDPQRSAAQKDGDGDGVANSNDQCPGTPAGAAVNADGCASASRDTADPDTSQDAHPTDGNDGTDVSDDTDRPGGTDGAQGPPEELSEDPTDEPAQEAPGPGALAALVAASLAALAFARRS